MNCKKQNFIIALFFISVVGLLLRWNGINFIGVDYEVCFRGWYEQLKSGGGLKGLTEFKGDYTMPYATMLLLLTHLPLNSLYAVKLLPILFDFLTSGVLTVLVMDIVTERKFFYGAVTYAMVLCCPVAVINSGYLGQCESIWAGLALLSFYLTYKDHPIGAMISLGCALSLKLQAIFILPLLLLFYMKKKFSILHFVLIPVTIEVLCIPAIIGGCSWDISFTKYLNMTGEYPFVYYFYPNVWTFLKDAPYYVFGKVAIFSAVTVLLCFAVLFVKNKKCGIKEICLETLCFTTITCPFILPCMHERYNYLGELCLVALAVAKPKYRLAALGFIMVSTQCYGQCFMGWTYVSPYILATINLGVYVYLAINICTRLYNTIDKGEGVYVEN